MKDWVQAEEIVKRLCGGRRTPGSGNKGQKGDVRLRGSGWMLEVKQTQYDWMDIEYEWLRQLENEQSKHDLAIVLFFGLRGYVYWHVGPPVGSPPKWSTRRIKECDLPAEIETPKSRWALDGLESLRELKR